MSGYGVLALGVLLALLSLQGVDALECNAAEAAVCASDPNSPGWASGECRSFSCSGGVCTAVFDGPVCGGACCGWYGEGDWFCNSQSQCIDRNVCDTLQPSLCQDINYDTCTIVPRAAGAACGGMCQDDQCKPGYGCHTQPGGGGAVEMQATVRATPGLNQVTGLATDTFLAGSYCETPGGVCDAYGGCDCPANAVNCGAPSGSIYCYQNPCGECQSPVCSGVPVAQVCGISCPQYTVSCQATSGGSCSDGGTCSNGVCIPPCDGCDIDGTCYSHGDLNPGNTCQQCDMYSNPGGWSNRARGTSCGTDMVCNNLGSCQDCNQDNDAYNRSVTDSTGQLCANPTDCLDSGSKNSRYGAIAASQINPGANERPTGTMCTDGIDNDCDTRPDYDAFTSGNVATYNPPLTNSGKGDSLCTVSVSAAGFACPVPRGYTIMANCTANVADIRSIQISAVGATCYPNPIAGKPAPRWIPGTTTYEFPCDITAASGSITCAVNEAYSEGVAPTTATKSWGGADCASVVCDQDGDGYNRTGVATCLNGNDCNDADATINPGKPEQWTAAGTCTDNVDNNCNGKADYDGGRNAGGNVTPSGEPSCPVAATAAGGPAAWCVSPGGIVGVNCTYHANTTQPRSKTATLTQGGTTRSCSFVSWAGNTALFDCPAEGAAGVATLTCGVDTGISTLLPPPATKSITLNGNGGTCDPSGCSPCVCNNGAVFCDTDCDTYNASNGGRCSVAKGVDCVDSPAQQLVNGQLVFLPAGAGGGPLTGANIYPGAPSYCGNDVFESCAACDPECTVTWEGELLSSDNLGVKGQVRYDTQPYVDTQSDGGIDVDGVPIGSRTLSGKAEGHDARSLLVNITGCTDTFEKDIVLSDSQCQADCTFEGFCRYDKCVGDQAATSCNITTVLEGASSLTLTAAEQALVAESCKFAEPGAPRELNSTHSILCCQGRIVPTGMMKSALSVQGCSDDLITMSRTVNYKGRIMTMEIMTYKKCE